MNQIKVGCYGFPRAENIKNMRYFSNIDRGDFIFVWEPRGKWSGDELARLRELSSGEAYVLFNNITMHDDALRFERLIQSGK